MIETNIDDMNPELYQGIMEKLFSAGALDVYISSVVMKKNRPGWVLHVLAPSHAVKQLGQAVLEHTTALGYRYYPVQRHILERKIISVDTGYGLVRVKVASRGRAIMNIAPEYADCLTQAELYQLPVKHIYNLAIKYSYQLIEKELSEKKRSL